VTFGKAEAYFDRLHARVWNHPHLPTWTGELYLEYHRGTYTSQARTKKANRESETLFRNAELFSALAMVEMEATYPQEQLNAGWQRILLNQFHDILPGSSIAPVYEEAARDYAEAKRLGDEALNSALNALAGAVDVRRDSVVLFNPTDTLRESDACSNHRAGQPGRRGVFRQNKRAAPRPDSLTKPPTNAFTSCSSMT
jgi:alpha-mannosidase